MTLPAIRARTGKLNELRAAEAALVEQEKAA